MTQFLYGGVNYSIPGDGGPDCVGYISTTQKFLETIVVSPLSLYATIWAYRRLRYRPVVRTPEEAEPSHMSRRLIAAVLCLVFGAELGYKMASQTFIYLLNPCHVATVAQIWLLLDEPSGWLTELAFRLHFVTLSGATLALVFPVINTRLLPYEVWVYYTQHSLILIVPFYLITLGGVYSVGSICDRDFLIFAMGLLILYHYIPLQLIGMLTHVNLNNMLCPAVSDPLRNHYWRLCSVVHQSLYVPLHTTLHATLCGGVLRIWKYLHPPRHSINGSVPVDCNGHAKET